MNRYLIAEAVGGLMEMPEFSYNNPQVIEANSRDESINIYNKKNNCSYFYGTCMAENINGDLQVINKAVKYEWIELIK
ncbi:MAG TPA: hypothetical protein VN026_00160 [Bacteroidia bacterium]|jgi:hypothetical protein|nr:hypothetical protein [Bacteroidia bacterium]